MCANARPFAITVRTDKEDDNLQNWPKLRKIRRCFRNSYWTFGYVKYLYLSAPKIVFHLRVNLFSEDCPQGPSTYQCTKLLITVQLGGGQWPKLRKNRRCFRNSYCSTGQFIQVKNLYLSAPKIVFQTKTILKRGWRCKMHKLTHPKCILCNFCEQRNETKSDHCFVSALSLSRWLEVETKRASRIRVRVCIM